MTQNTLQIFLVRFQFHFYENFLKNEKSGLVSKDLKKWILTIDQNV
jgi:hypothetical protein